MESNQDLLRLKEVGEQMRHWQKTFFKSKPGSMERNEALTKSKQTEKEFDELIEKLNSNQLTLL
jgi:hypothetical protein